MQEVPSMRTYQLQAVELEQFLQLNHPQLQLQLSQLRLMLTMMMMMTISMPLEWMLWA